MDNDYDYDFDEINELEFLAPVEEGLSASSSSGSAAAADPEQVSNASSVPVPVSSVPAEVVGGGGVGAAAVAAVQQAGALPVGCYVQRAVLHPDDSVRVLPWVAGNLVVRAGNALSDDREMDAELTPAAVRAATCVIEFYCVWLLGMWVALTWLFLLTEGGARWCGVGMRVPGWMSRIAEMADGPKEPYDSPGGRAFWGAGVPLWYFAKSVRDELQPRIMDWSGGATPTWLFLVLFLSLAILLSVVSADTWWWAGACALLPLSFVDAYTQSQRLPTGVMEVAHSPIEALQQAVTRVVTPASAQYLRMFGLAAMLALLWLPFLLPLLVRAVFVVGLIGIPLCSLRSTLHTVRAMCAAQGQRVPRVFAMLTCGACLLGVRQTVSTVHHPPALALLLSAQGAVFVALLLFLLI